MPKNILFIIDSLGAGGAEKVVLTLARTLADLGHKVVIISIDDTIEYPVDFNVEMHTIKFKKHKLEPTYFKYSKKLKYLYGMLLNKYGDFHLVTSHLQKAHRLTKKAKIANAYYCIHSTVSQGSLGQRTGLRLSVKRFKLKTLLDKQNLITVSNGIANDLIHTVHINPKSIQTIYNPIDFKTINSQATEPNPYSNENYIVHLGRLTSSKRHDILLKAYAHADLIEKLILVGDGPLKTNIKRLTEELNLQDKVIFAGFQKNPYPILKGAKLSVMSSDYEGLPTAIIESLVLGVPVVSTDCPSGPREILTDAYAKQLSPVGNISALTQSIKYTINEINEHSFHIDKNLAGRFNADKVAAQYLALAHD